VVCRAAAREILDAMGAEIPQRWLLAERRRSTDVGLEATGQS